MRIAVLIVAAALSVAAAPNWLASVRIQPATGAFVMGNPAARVKLVEYLSYTCGHCAHFVGESKVALKRDYVARGVVSVEIRNAVRDSYDLAAALLARCGGPARFFGNSEAIFAAQPQWLARTERFHAANGARIRTLPMNEALKAMARGVGLDAIMKARGFSPARIDACLIDKVAQDRIAAMSDEAWKVRKINGTPAFLVNGALNRGDWPQIEQAIKADAAR